MKTAKQTDDLAAIAGRIDRNMKRLDEIAALPKHHESAPPLLLTRIVARLRHGFWRRPKPEPTEEERFSEVERRLEAIKEARKAFARQAAQQDANAEEWQRRAVLAVRSGYDDLAQNALSRKREHVDAAAECRRQVEAFSAALEEYEAAIAAIKRAEPT